MASTDFTDTVTLVQSSWLDDVDRSVYSYLTSVAGTNTITATGSVTANLTTGNMFRFTPANTNTGATTLNITPSGGSALGAKNVFAVGGACTGGEIIQNVPAVVIYDGTQFNLVGGANPVATQAQMEAATSLVNFSSPARQHFHPGHAKCVAMVTVSAGTPTLQTPPSYNITSITDTGPGILTITIATDFSSANWCCLPATESANPSADSVPITKIGSTEQAAGSVVLRHYTIGVVDSPPAVLTPTAADPIAWHMVGLGDQA